MTDILIINKSALITPEDIASWLPAINTQISRDFAPAWNAPGTVWFGPALTGAWQFTLQDGIDQAGDLGYHLLADGSPEARIDAKGAADTGNDWRTVAGHEILEALADPSCTRMAPDGITICEVCDPVEESMYLIDGVPVTNFVLPDYFNGRPAPKYDFNGQLTGPCPNMLPGGYLMRYIGGGWVSQFAGALGAAGFMATRPNGRNALRASRPTP